MRLIRTAAVLLIRSAAVLLILFLPGPLRGQVAPSPAGDSTLVYVVPGPEYEAGPFRRFLLGDNRRDLWLRELTVQRLDLDGTAGGLTIEGLGSGGSDLFLRGADGRGFVFRPVDHAIHPLPADLRGTLLGLVVRDHVSMLHPGAAVVPVPLHDALGHATVHPAYRIPPDDPRLGEHREDFSGVLGTLTEREGDAGGPDPEWRRRIRTDALYERLAAHPGNRPAAREYLAARMVDFLVGDSDRGPEKWRWTPEPGPRGIRWRPVTLDHEWAFVQRDGVVPWLASRVFPKLVAFGPELPSIASMTSADEGMGRRLLAGLDGPAFDSVASAVVARLTDPIIHEAVIALPAELKPGHAQELVETLKARRAQLPRAARDWYGRLATDVDVRGTDLADRAEAIRHEDGRVTVTLFARTDALRLPSAGDPAAGETGWMPYYHRVFRPEETREVRIYLGDGADRAVVRGRGTGAIQLRLIGGAGADTLHDDAEPSGATALYDDDHSNRIVPGPRTFIDRRPFEPPPPAPRLGLTVLGHEPHRDWGSRLSAFWPTVDYREGAGVILGGGPSWTEYGFRSVPYRNRIAVDGLLPTTTVGIGVNAVGETRFPGSPTYIRLLFRATSFEGVRFYGYGNDSPRLHPDTAFVRQERLVAEALLGTEGKGWRIQFGPVLRYTNPTVPAGNPAVDELGGEIVTATGAAVRVGLDRVAGSPELPLRLEADLDASLYPEPEGGLGPFARAETELRGYLPVPIPNEAVLAFRAGARGSWGSYPIHMAAAIGGSSTVRGYRWQRFAGDAAVYGGLELRAPLAHVDLRVVRGRLGVLGLVDAGRVWIDGDSAGGWHTGYGAGLFLRTLETTIFGAWAHGEENRLYAGLGMPF